MPEKFQSWMDDSVVSQILIGWKADALNEEQQRWLEDLVSQGRDLNLNTLTKLKKALGLKPLAAKHFVSAIQDATSGFGNVGGTDPHLATDSDSHRNAGGRH